MADKKIKFSVFADLHYKYMMYAPTVEDLFAKANNIRKGTVIMAINGHYHTNHLTENNGIVYMDVNTVKNGAWIAKGYPHYNDEHTFKVTEYDDDGNAIAKRDELLKKPWMSPNTWYFEEPLSAIITIRENGHIAIDGMKTAWAYDVTPEADGIGGCETQISSKEFKLNF